MAIQIIKKSISVLSNINTNTEIKSNFVPSIYQSAIFDFIINGNGNAVIDAVAGSGKSTTIVQALNLLPENAKKLMLAFNVPIVKELEIKTKGILNLDVKTLNGFGCTAINKTFEERRPILEDKKYEIIINDWFSDGYIKASKRLDYTDFCEYRSNFKKLVNLYRSYLCTSIDDLLIVADKYQLNIIDNECEYCQEIVQYGVNNIRTIDFADQLYLPNVLQLSVEKYDYVLIDECQDLNTAQRMLFLQAFKPTTRFIAVGDPRQAIYGFAGADIDSFNALKVLPNTINLPLSVSYRCDQSIINLAQEIVPQIEARDNALEGIVDHQSLIEHIQDGDLVLCRVTAPLVALCMQYIGSGIKAYVKGKDIGTNLINMIKHTKQLKMDGVFIKLDIELEKIALKASKKLHCEIEDVKDDNLYKSFNDKVQAITVLSDNLDYSCDVISRIETIFKDDQKNGICLSSVHKSKGLESDNVYIICPDKFYNKKSMKIQWQAEQEKNLVYVALTRAKHKLGFVIDFKMD